MTSHLSDSLTPVCLWKQRSHCFLQIGVSMNTMVANVSPQPATLTPMLLSSRSLSFGGWQFLVAFVVRWLSQFLHDNITLGKEDGREGVNYLEMIQDVSSCVTVSMISRYSSSELTVNSNLAGDYQKALFYPPQTYIKMHFSFRKEYLFKA